MAAAAGRFARGVGGALGVGALGMTAATSRARSSGCDEGKSKPLRFAAIADIQFADIESRRGRYYRESLGVTQRSAKFFNEHGGLDFFLHAGDLVDFYNTVDEFADDRGRQTASAVADVMTHLDEVRAPHSVFLIGNHELYNWSREELLSGVPWQKPERGSSGVLRFCPEGSGELWHSFSPCAGWHCIVLDPYDVSVYRRGRQYSRPPPYNYDLDAAAVSLLCRHNTNVATYVAEHPGENILCNYWKDIPDGDPTGRWSPINGAIGATQMAWLRGELDEAAGRGDRVVILSHVLVHPGSSDGKTLLWNYDEVLWLLQSPTGRAVQCVVSGHQHIGGLHTDECGIHYIVMESPLNTPPDGPGAFFVAEADDVHLTLSGYGNAGSPIFPDAPAAPGAPSQRRLRLRSAVGESNL